MEEKKDILEEEQQQAEQQTQVIDAKATQAIGSDVSGVDMIEGEPIGIGETEVMDLTTFKSDADNTHEELNDEKKQGNISRRAFIAAGVAAIAVIGGGVAMANPFASLDQPQQSASASAPSSSSAASSKASKSSSSSSSKAADENKGSQSTAEEQQSDNQQDAGAASQQEKGHSANANNNGSESSEPQRHWVDEKGHYEKKLVQDAYDEPIYEQQGYTVCNYCGADITQNPGAHLREHAKHGENATCGGAVRTVQTGTKHHDAVYEQVYVIDIPGYWE